MSPSPLSYICLHTTMLDYARLLRRKRPIPLRDCITTHQPSYYYTTYLHYAYIPYVTVLCTQQAFQPIERGRVLVTSVRHPQIGYSGTTHLYLDILTHSSQVLSGYEPRNLYLSLPFCFLIPHRCIDLLSYSYTPLNSLLVHPSVYIYLASCINSSLLSSADY